MDYDNLLKTIKDRYDNQRDAWEIIRSMEMECLIEAYAALEKAKIAYNDLTPEYK